MSAKELLAFDKDISPRPPKQKWIMRLRELLVVTPLEDKIPVLCKEVCDLFSIIMIHHASDHHILIILAVIPFICELIENFGPF